MKERCEPCARASLNGSRPFPSPTRWLARANFEMLQRHRHHRSDIKVETLRYTKYLDNKIIEFHAKYNVQNAVQNKETEIK